MKPTTCARRLLVVDNAIGNMGDAAILLAMQRSLLDAFGPGSTVKNCFCGVAAEPGAYAEYYPGVAFVPTLWHAAADGTGPRWNVWRRALRRSVAFRFPLQAALSTRGLPTPLLYGRERSLLNEYRMADAVIVTGGGFLSSHWTWRAVRATRVAQYHAAIALGKPLVFYAQSFGPFREGDPLPRMLRPVMERAAAVLCRDEVSERVVRETIGVRTDNVHLTIDEAVLLQPREPEREIAPRRARPFRIGVCAHRWHWSGDPRGATRQGEFEARVADACARIVEQRDAELVFVTAHQRVPLAQHVEEEVSERIREALPERVRERAHVVHGFVHPQDFAHLMGTCDAVISSRMHGAILSMVGGTPVVALAYEPKTPGFFARVGMEDRVLSMWETPASEIADAVLRILDDVPEARARAAGALDTARSIARRNAQIVANALADCRRC